MDYGLAMKLEKHIFKTIVKFAPLISIDLIVINETGEILLGFRKNLPAKNIWFVPGGVMRKNEPLKDAFWRITKDELGKNYQLERACFWGIYEHFYDENFLGEAGFGTHYVVLAYEIKTGKNFPFLPHEQHQKYHWFKPDTLMGAADVHPYTKDYFRNRGNMLNFKSGG